MYNRNIFEKFSYLKKIDITDKEELKKQMTELLNMDISSESEIIDFQKKRDFIEKHFINECSESYFLFATDLTDKVSKNRRIHINKIIKPIYEEFTDLLNQKMLKAMSDKDLGTSFNTLKENQINERNLYNPSNIGLNKKIATISSEVNEVLGGLTAEWRGEQVTIPRVKAHLKDQNRQIRKEAYESVINAPLSVSNDIDEKFNQLVKLRHQIALNAGFDNYIDYRFKEMKRFDWDKKDCFEFHKAVKKHIVPLREKMMIKRKKSLNLNVLMPYDLSVDITGEKPLRICEEGNSKYLLDRAGKVIKSINDELFQYFTHLRDNNLIDLEARKNKVPGPFMINYPLFETASVSLNSTGMAHDLMNLLHEVGHCAHFFLGKNVFPHSLQHWTYETAEAGSLCMEYFGLEEMDKHFPLEECNRIKTDKLQKLVWLFLLTAKGDEFQHWIYENPEHTVEERRQKWSELEDVYYKGVDDSEYRSKLSKTEWQIQHILNMPFYYIDYSISEILALSLWDRYKQDPKDAISKYKSGCSLAASRSVSEIYNTFGTTLSFGEDKIVQIADMIKKELSL